MLKSRLEATLEHELMSTQFGFRKGRSTIYALFTARRIQDFAERAGYDGTLLFLDWAKAFDKVDQGTLIAVLESYNIPHSLMKVLRSIYADPEFKVRIDGRDSDWHKQSTGIRQGCPLSPYLFIVVMHVVFEMVLVDVQNRCSNESGEVFVGYDGMPLDYHELLFADDTLLFAGRVLLSPHCYKQSKMFQLASA